MSRTPGKAIRRPAKGLFFNPREDVRSQSRHKLSNFYLNFFDHIDVMAVMIDDCGAVRLFNRKAEKLTGHSSNEVLGRDWFSLLPEGARERARERLMEGLRQGVRHMALLMPVATKTGGALAVCWSMSLVRDDDGNACGLFGLGFAPAGHDAPCKAMERQMECYCASVNAMTHDMLNHTQVVMGYLEMAAERSGGDLKLQCMLERATKSMVKCGDMAVSMHKLNDSR